MSGASKQGGVAFLFGYIKFRQLSDSTLMANAGAGEHTLYLSPALRLAVDNWAGHVLLGIPVFNDSNGIQAKPDWRLVSGISVAFGR